jgi:FKBP-type peptidyl-prolyl cis-trans isomerase
MVGLGVLLPRDFLERQPIRWQKSQKKRGAIHQLQRLSQRREKIVAKAMRNAERDSERHLADRQAAVEAATGSTAGASARREARVSRCTPFASRPRGLWAAELQPNQALIVTLPRGVRLRLLRASLSAASPSPKSTLVRCRVPASPAVATLCHLRGDSAIPTLEAARAGAAAMSLGDAAVASRPLRTEFSWLDGRCALAAEGSSAVHLIGHFFKDRRALRDDRTRSAKAARDTSHSTQQAIADQRTADPVTSAQAPPSRSGSAPAAASVSDGAAARVDRPPVPPARVPTAQPAGVAAATTAISRSAAPSAGIAAAPPSGMMEHPNGLKFVDVVEGTGRAAARGDRLAVKYEGMTARRPGEWHTFDDNRGKLMHFVLGMGEVIRGWDQGLIGMRRGGTRRLVVPAHLGYGARGAGAKIAPDATLVFQVRLMNVQPAAPG